LIAIGAFFIAGCGGAKIFPVTGKVTLKGGKPLAGALVEFETTQADGKRVTARGETKEDGSYSLETPELGAGAVAGEHKVIVSPPAYPPGNFAGPPPQSLLDKKYQSYGSTPLKFKVQPSGPFTYNIEVTGPASR
jgi:hypothetical protein